MRMLLFRGKSVVSKLIQWQTRSPYSHVAVELDDGSIIEAWYIGGVRELERGDGAHKPGTVVEAYTIEVEYDSEKVDKFFRKQLGKAYDYRSIPRFVTRKDAPDNDKWFCSELFISGFLAGGCELLRGNPSHISPRDTAMIPYLKFDEEFTL